MVKGDNNIGANDGYLHSGCDLASHTCKGFESASCSQDDQCQFTVLEWWGAYNSPKPLKTLTGNVQPNVNQGTIISWDSGAYTYPSYGHDLGPTDFPDTQRSVGQTWWTAGDKGIHENPDLPSQGIGDKAAGKDIGGYDLAGSRVVIYKVSPTSGINEQDFVTKGYSVNAVPYLARFPGAYAGAVLVDDPMYDEYYGSTGSVNTYGVFIPGHCEKPVTKTLAQLDADLAPSTYGDARVKWEDIYDRPYVETSRFCADDTNLEDWDENDLCLESYEHLIRRYFGGDPSLGSGGYLFGTCEGGSKEGASCFNSKQCQPAGLTQAELDDQKTWCRNVNDQGLDALCHPPGFVGDPSETDLDKDDNACTHNAGYYPRADLCGSSPTRPQCLTGYQLTGPNKATSVNPDEALPPTDVTAGLYTPDYLGAPQDASNFGYAAWYIPRPPALAAPDTSKACAAAGQCSIAQTNTFSLEGKTEGDVSYVGGQAVGTIRFYGWAADNQGGIKDALVDWGDGNVQHIQDAQMKNKKPFCETAKECEFIPGLSCRSDADCPPAGGKCAQTGFCKARSHVSCSRNEDCNIGIIKDTCQTRLTFGNSELACEQNFFEFTHAFACPKEAAIDLPNCGASYCSRDSSRLCGTASDCAPGDSCVAGLAPPGGCFDPTKNACRFTPRVMLKDMWGWCTGECRTKVLPNGQLANDSIGQEKVIYKNGGCYDGSGVYSNVDSSVSAGLGNSCDPITTAGTNARPWVIYQGALQLGIQP
jgi:hypothetical protein